jgi:hypothetical protein
MFLQYLRMRLQLITSLRHQLIVTYSLRHQLIATYSLRHHYSVTNCVLNTLVFKVVGKPNLLQKLLSAEDFTCFSNSHESPVKYLAEGVLVSATRTR